MQNERITSLIRLATPIIASNGDFTFNQHTHFMNGQISKLQRTGITLPHTGGQHILSIGKSSQRVRRFSTIENHISRIMQCRLQASRTRTLGIDAGKGNVAHFVVSRMKSQ